MEPHARAEFLRRSGASPEEQARVLAMLRADASTTGLDDARGGIDLVAALTEDPSDKADPLPTLRGYYRVIRLIGEGGSGAVYEAEQASPRRRVAIKAIRAGLASRRAVRRLRAEADILARLHHPGIAQVFEAGLGEEHQTDQAFIVMELVEGLPIHRHSESAGLDRRARVSLMLQVCHAVEHAHQRGVIHRDLKPANILVDGQGQAKVLDFGVARLLSDDGEAADVTEHGAVVGTLGYMSPEQASGRSQSVDVRSDVYALGAILYELLSGRPALDLHNASLTAALRLIEVQTPRPLGAVDRSLRGDLSVIAARALEKDPARRFPSVAALAEDLQRSLDGRPILSRPQSAAYVVARHARRHWLITTLAAALVLTMLGVFVKTSVDARRFRLLAASESRAREIEAAAREAAERARVRGDEINALLEAELAAADIERARLEARAGNGSAAESVLWPAFFRDPESAAVQGALWEMFESHPCDWTVVMPDATAMAGDRAGSWLGVGRRDGSVAWLSAADGAVLAELAPDEDTSQVISLLETGPHRAFIVQRSGRVREVAIGDESVAVGSSRFLPAEPVGAAVSDDGSHAAFLLADGRVIVQAGTDILAEWKAGEARQRSAAFSPDARLLAVVGADRIVRVWEAATGRLIHSLEGHDREPYAVLFADNGDSLFSLAVDQSLRRWSLATGGSEVVARIGDIPRSIHRLPDSSLVMAEGDRVWLQPTPKAPLQSVAFPRSGFALAAYAPDAVYTLEWSGDIRRWSTSHGVSRSIRPLHRSWVFGVDVSPRHNLMVTTAGDPVIRFSDPATGIESGRFALPDRVRARCVRFSPDESVFAVGCSDGVVRIFDAGSRELLTTLAGPAGEIYSLAFAPDGSMLSAGAWSRSIRLWSLPDHAVLGDVISLSSVPRGMAFSPDASVLYSSGDTGGVVVTDTALRAVRTVIPTPAEPWAVAVSPDGTRLGVGLFDASVALIDLATGRVTPGPSRHRLVVAGLDFSPDGRLLASGGDDGTIRIWDTQAGVPRAVRLLDPAFGAVPVVRFVEADRLVAGTSGGHLIQWDLSAHHAAIARNVESAARIYAPPASGIDTTKGLQWADRALNHREHAPTPAPR